MGCDVKTISERIEAAVRDFSVDCSKTWASAVGAVVKKHFTEPWLDAPDGDGLWWRRDDYGDSMHDVGKYPETKLNPGKWQRAIGPSE